MSNCLLFALAKWWKHGGYVIIRKSHWGWWPHFIWCKDLRDAEIEQYVPIGDKLPFSFMKVLFKGKIVTKDVPK